MEETDYDETYYRSTGKRRTPPIEIPQIKTLIPEKRSLSKSTVGPRVTGVPPIEVPQIGNLTRSSPRGRRRGPITPIGVPQIGTGVMSESMKVQDSHRRSYSPRRSASPPRSYSPRRSASPPRSYSPRRSASPPRVYSPRRSASPPRVYSLPRMPPQKTIISPMRSASPPPGYSRVPNLGASPAVLSVPVVPRITPVVPRITPVVPRVSPTRAPEMIRSEPNSGRINISPDHSPKIMSTRPYTSNPNTQRRINISPDRSPTRRSASPTRSPNRNHMMNNGGTNDNSISNLMGYEGQF